MGSKVGAALVMAMVTVGAPRVADACGGCFHAEPVPVGVSAGGESEGTVVTGHRMVFSISKTQSVLWDQIEYAGNPEEFSWVLPVKPGAVLEVASDAWLDVLDGATQPSVGSKTVQCTQFVDQGGSNGGGFGNGSAGFDCGCGSSGDASGGDGGYTEQIDNEQGGQADPVSIVSQKTVGPYETVTLSTEQPGVLQDWLQSHGYVIPDDVVPIIDEYVAEGFDFVAMRLIPGTGVHQMRPVRVVMPGAVLSLPLRLVAAGTGAKTALSLFVISEGPYEAQNFANAIVPRSSVTWDYATSSSNYAELRQQALAGDDGETWLRTYAMANSLFEPVLDEATEDPGDVVDYGGSRDILAEAFWSQAGGWDAECHGALMEAFNRGLTVVEPCDEDGNCKDLEPHEIAAEELQCNHGADDLVTALTGMNLTEVWITRMDAELPRSGLDRDLILEARTPVYVNNRMLAGQSINSPCEGLQNGPTPAVLGGPLRRVPGGLPTVGLALLGLLFAGRRRSRLADRLSTID